MRLIDATPESCVPYLGDHLDDDHMIAAKNAIDDMPTIDAVPVRRGWWNVYSAKNSLYTCSVCNHLPVSKTPYYPFCGARMENYRDV